MSRPLTVRSAEAIGAGVTTANDDNALTGGEDLIGHRITFADPVGLGQELHGEVNAFQFAARNVQIAGLFCAGGQQDGIKAHGGNAAIDITIHTECHAFGAHLSDAPINGRLLHFEVRNAVAQQAADTVFLFKHGDTVTGPGQLLRRRQACRT